MTCLSKLVEHTATVTDTEELGPESDTEELPTDLEDGMDNDVGLERGTPAQDAHVTP